MFFKFFLSQSNFLFFGLFTAFFASYGQTFFISLFNFQIRESINLTNAEKEFEHAKNELNQLESQTNSTKKVKAQETLNKARAKFQASLI